MLVRFHEKRLLILFLITSILFALLGVTSFVYALIGIFALEEPFDQLLDVVTMLFHLLCVAMAIVFLVAALKKESFFMKGLTVKPDGKPAYRFTITFLSLGSILFLIAIYFALGFFGVPVYIFHFPEVLTLTIINAFSFVFIVSFFFFLYPFGYNKDIHISNSL